MPRNGMFTVLALNVEQKDLCMSNETFREAVKKLREVNIFERSSPKNKKVPIRFTPNVRGKYPFIEIPSTYLSITRIADINYKHGRIINEEDRKSRQERYSNKRGIIMQRLLKLSVFGTTYARRITDPSEQYKPGLILTYRDTKGHSYSSEDIQTSLTQKQVKSLDPIILETDTIAGVSVLDNIIQKDIGGGGVFGYLDASREECTPIVEDLAQIGVFARMTNDEVSNSISKTANPGIYPAFLEETRYKIGSETLKRFVEDWDCLQYYLIRCIEVKWMMNKKRNREERDFYDYCNGFNALNRFRSHLKFAYDKMSMAEKNKGRVEVQSSDGMQIEYHLSKRELYEAWKHEFEHWARLIQTKSDEIRSKQEYIEIINKYPFLPEMLNITLRPIPKILGIKKGQVR